MLRRSPTAVRVAVAAAAVVVAVAAGAAPGPAAAVDAGPQVRLGHFAPGVPDVDVYLSAAGSGERLVLHGLRYGDVSQYMPVPPGRYGYSMRRAGNPNTAPKLLSGFADFTGARSYTFIAFKRGSRVETRAFVDDAQTPEPGSGSVRLINTADSRGPVDVTALNGPVLARNLGVGSASAYSTVPGGEWQVRVDARRAAQPVEQTLSVRPGTVNTLVVLNGPGSAQIVSVVDATGIAGTTAAGLPTTGPVGGVQTGGGGEARTFTSAAGSGGTAATVVGAVAIATAAAVALGRRRSRATP